MFIINSRWISFCITALCLATLAPLISAQARPPQQDGPIMQRQDGVEVEISPKSGMATGAIAAATSYRTYAGGSFQPTISTLEYAPSGGAIYATVLAGGGYSFIMELDLPNGAQVSQVDFYVIDNDATNLSVGLYSYNPVTSSYVVLKTVSSTGVSATVQTLSLVFNPVVTIDNATLSYRLRFEPGVASSAHLLRGARVSYTVSSVYLPAVSK